MWLINVQTPELKLEYKLDARRYAGRYAILSHRWERDEVTHFDMIDPSRQKHRKEKKGWYKIAKCCERAKAEGLSYAWVDTCCIDKTNSAELEESINSMYRWYQDAKVCYVYISDVIEPRSGRAEPSTADLDTQLRQSQWFTRGWTLQELVAPREQRLYDRFWTDCGSRSDNKYVISEITHIPTRYLVGFEPRWVAESILSVAEIMSWAAGRYTTRIEDRAYSLLGLFGVSMPLLYGEGEKSFRRLQEELLRIRDDQSIFAWQRVNEDHALSTPLADSPDNFKGPPRGYIWLSPTTFERRKPHNVTNEGISVELLLRPIQPGVYHAVVNAVLAHEQAEGNALGFLENGVPTHLGAAFPVQQIDLEGRFVRLLPQNVDSLHFPELPLNLQHYQLRLVTLVNYLKRVEADIANENESSEFLVGADVAEHWLVDDISSLALSLTPEQRPHEVPKARSIGGSTAASATALLTWNGWPHKIEWIPFFMIRTIVFGFDFDFNPFCLIYTGSHKYDQQYLDAINGYANITQGFVQKAKVYDETAKIIPSTVRHGQYAYWVPQELLSSLFGSAETGKQFAYMVKATPATRSSGRGLDFTIDLDTSSVTDYYGGGRVEIKVSRDQRVDPWTVSVKVAAVQNRPIWRGIAPKHSILVAPFPARRLGTWAEHKAAKDTDHEYDRCSVDTEHSL